MCQTKKQRYWARFAIAWLLFLSLLPYNVVKDTHHHADDWETCGSHGAENHDTCPICSFALSLFTEPELPFATYTVGILFLYFPEAKSERIFHLSFSHGLRAPPYSC
ncbi:MAG: hypothetical protein LBS52_00255 [Dysgonamonadaceae bacterium]|jgi:hypothetical protein|nr:hypothetical protein [Dysgonamonadaceae bacterium]